MAESGRYTKPRPRAGGCLTAAVVLLALGIGLTTLAFAATGAAVYLFMTHAERGLALPPPPPKK